MFKLVGILLVVSGCGSTMTPNQVRTNIRHTDALAEEEFTVDNEESAYVTSSAEQTGIDASETNVDPTLKGELHLGSEIPQHKPSAQLVAKFDAQKLKITPTLLQHALSEMERVKSLITNKRFFAIVDFSLPSSEKRFWLIDANSGKLVFRSFVSHGRGSGSRMHATKFSNVVGSKASSLGSYIATTPYRGDHGPALRMIGLSSTNSNAAKRNIVIHGASYVPIIDEVVTKLAGVGRSEGCFAFGFDKTAQVVAALNGGGFIYAGLSRGLKPAKAPKPTKATKVNVAKK